MQVSGSRQSALQHIFALHENKNSAFKQLDLSVLGIGYAVVDLAISVEEQFLKALGTNKGQPQVVEWPVFSQLHDKAAKATSGGSAANTMKGLAQLGQKSAFLGKIGPDEKGIYFQDRLISLKVQPLLLKSETPTTQVACLITPDKERTMLVFLGAGKELIGKDLTPEHFSGVKLVHLDGYSLWNEELFGHALKMAKDAGALISFDLGSIGIVKDNKKMLLEMLPHYVDIVFGNEDEVRALTDRDPVEGLDVLKQMCKLAVLKVGKDGCYVATRDDKFHSPGIPPKELVDTTGAGDYFASGFLYALLNNYPLRDCAHAANIVGSAAVEVLGAEIPQSTWTELRSPIVKQFKL